MDRYVHRTCQLAKDIHSYHKKFSYFQKIVIFSLLIGLVSITCVQLLTVVLVYFLAIVSTVATCRFLLSSHTNFTFGVSVLNFHSKHKYVLSKIFSFLRSLGSSSDDPEKDPPTPADDNSDNDDDDQFYDVDDNFFDNNEKKKIKTAEENKEISPTAEGSKQQGVKYNQKEENDAQSFLPDGHWEDELKMLMDFICRDFIEVWYSKFEGEGNVFTEIYNILHTTMRHLCEQFRKMDFNKLCAEYLLLYRQHLHNFQIARTLYKTQPRRRSVSHHRSPSTVRPVSAIRRMNSVEEAFENKFTYHIGVWGTENEIVYVRSIVQLILSQLVPEQIKNCHTSQLVLVEILTCKVFLPLLELLSDPDFLHELLIQLLSDEKLVAPVDSRENVAVDYNDEKENQKKEFNKLKIPSSVNKSKSSDNITHYCDHHKSYLHNDHRLSCPSSHEVENEGGLLITKAKSCQELYNAYCHENALSSNIKKNVHGAVLPPVMHQSDDKSPVLSVESFADNGLKNLETNVEIYLENDELENFNAQDHLEILSVEKPWKKTITDSSVESEYDVVTAVNRSFTDISIIATETAHEMRSTTTYTLYHIQYDALYFIETGCLEHRTKDVKRRFREFINLQARLEDNDAYKQSLRDIKGPKRWLSLPFGNMDRKSVKGRRASLETFLRSLIQKEDICNGPELKEFLAYEGDGHIAFVRKAPELTVPRIDKMLAKTVTGMIDKIGELSSKAQDRLPSLPGKRESTPQLEDGKPAEDQDQISVEFCTLIDSDKAPNLETLLKDYISQDHTVEDKGIDVHQTASCRKNSSQLEIEKQVPATQNSGKEKPAKVEDTIFLADAIIDLGIQTLQTRDCWVCREKVVIMTKRLIGTTLNRFLSLEIDSLTSDDKFYFYLHLLRNTFWPNGTFSLEDKKVKTDKHKELTREQARRCLANFFPGILQNIVGEEDYQFGVNEAIDSIQHKKLNKNFLFKSLDHLVEKLFPDMRKS